MPIRVERTSSKYGPISIKQGDNIRLCAMSTNKKRAISSGNSEDDDEEEIQKTVKKKKKREEIENL